ncbi:polysaccharide biosynthesis C-terminal domain-containing protein, partial [Vibrio navarrensis]
LKILLFSTFGSIGNFVLFPALQAINKVKYVANIVGPIAILNIILSFSLRELGAEGMAIALTSSMIVCSIITVFVLLRLKDKK